MAGGGERQAMALMLRTNTEMVAAVLTGAQDDEPHSVMAAIVATRALGLLVDDTLHALVHQARAEGHTWAEIGELLHITRQGAFQRFGGASATTGADEGAPRPIPEAGAKATAIFEDYLNERWSELSASFDRRMKQAASVELLKSALRRVEATFGAFLEFGIPTSSVRGDYTVLDVPMAFEKGDVNGRVSFNADEQVAGLFFLPVDKPGVNGNSSSGSEISTDPNKKEG